MSSSNTHVNAADSSSTPKWKWYLKDLDKIPKNDCKVFSCFSCGGGSSMGYKLAGYTVLGNVEIDPKIIAIYRKNLHPKHSFLMDIRDFILKEDIPDELYDIDILDGSPPCSTFSTAGQREKGWGVEKKFREGQKAQRLDDLFFPYIELAKKLQPKVVVAENVVGIIKGNAKGYINEILKAFDDAGYIPQIFVLNAAAMGVPQRRERVFFVCHRKDLKYPKLMMGFNEKPIPFRDVRSDQGVPISKDCLSAKLLSRRNKDDKDLGDISIRVRGKSTGFTAKIFCDNVPALTLCSGGDYYRMVDAMKISKQDIINVQTFPQDYDFGDNPAQYVCGMSVPPIMMYRIAREIYRQWLGGEKIGKDGQTANRD